MKQGSVLYIQLPVYKGHCREFENVHFIYSFKLYALFIVFYMQSFVIYVYGWEYICYLHMQSSVEYRVGWPMNLISNLASSFKTEVPIFEY